MVFEKREYDVIDFASQYRVVREGGPGCRIQLGSEIQYWKKSIVLNI